MAINRAEVEGFVGHDPEVRFSKNGVAVANFSVATTFTWDRAGVKNERTDWHKIVAFKDQAEWVGKNVRKGSLVNVKGPMQTDKYTDREGVARQTTKVIAREINLVEKKARGNGVDQSARQRDEHVEPDQRVPPEAEDDIPF